VIAISIKALHESFLLKKYETVNLEIDQFKLPLAPLAMKQRGNSYNFGPSQIGIGDQKKVLDSLGNSAGILNQILSNTYSGFISAKIETL